MRVAAVMRRRQAVERLDDQQLDERPASAGERSIRSSARRDVFRSPGGSRQQRLP